MAEMIVRDAIADECVAARDVDLGRRGRQQMRAVHEHAIGTLERPVERRSLDHIHLADADALLDEAEQRAVGQQTQAEVLLADVTDPRERHGIDKLELVFLRARDLLPTHDEGARAELAALAGARMPVTHDGDARGIEASILAQLAARLLRRAARDGGDEQ
jgi:hypothetical protein